MRHLISHGAEIGLEQQKALLGMQQEKVTPGPPAFSLQSLIDVSGILVNGIHRAMLDFSIKYGPVSRCAPLAPSSVCAHVGKSAQGLASRDHLHHLLRFTPTSAALAYVTGSLLPYRFANPTALNAASGWLFVNDPENVQYLCATNVRNYGRRYLPDIYKWVTHEKGILGSQACLHKPCNLRTYFNFGAFRCNSVIPVIIPDPGFKCFNGDFVMRCRTSTTQGIGGCVNHHSGTKQCCRALPA